MEAGSLVGVPPAMVEQFTTLRTTLPADVNKALNTSDVMRFLMARKGDVEKTKAMILAWYEWYKAPLPGSTATPENILSAPDPQEEVYRDLLPHTNNCKDMVGRPVYWERTGIISARMGEILSKLSCDDIVIRHVRQQEMMVARLNTGSAGRDASNTMKGIIVFDLQGMAYNINPTAMTAFKRTLQIDQAYYPERLHRLYFINCPWFFQAVWVMMKPWLDAVTAEKIQLLGKNYYTELCKVISPKDIPQEYGGERADFFWTWPQNWDSDKTFWPGYWGVESCTTP